MVKALDSRSRGGGFDSREATTMSGNNLKQVVHTPCASVTKWYTLVLVLQGVAEVTAIPAESNGSLPPGLWRDSLHVTCGLTACTTGSAPRAQRPVTSMGERYLYLYIITGGYSNGSARPHCFLPQMLLPLGGPRPSPNPWFFGISWSHPSQHPRRHLDRFSRF